MALSSLSPKQFQPGHSFDLTGQWLYKPGYAIATNERPEIAGQEAGFFARACPAIAQSHPVVAG